MHKIPNLEAFSFQIAIFLEKLKATLHVLYFPDKDACTLEHSDSSHPVYMVKTSGKERDAWYFIGNRWF